MTQSQSMYMLTKDDLNKIQLPTKEEYFCSINKLMGEVKEVKKVREDREVFSEKFEGMV